jgi:hypothetical protein
MVAYEAFGHHGVVTHPVAFVAHEVLFRVVLVAYFSSFFITIEHFISPLISHVISLPISVVIFKLAAKPRRKTK